jgi:methylenetetrahydrofolate--tRNA-(uracil-5-)-methyltransferase
LTNAQPTVTVVGAGLAGSECALQLASRGVKVKLCEQRPEKTTDAHHTALPAELVCSNSLKQTRMDSAAGLLKHELSEMGSFVLKAAYDNAVPAGGALAVNREEFSRDVARMIAEEPNIEIVTGEVTELPEGPCVVAAGPLCSDALFSAISDKVGAGSLAFYDAAAPIVDAATIDYDKVFSQSRYEKEAQGDYLNCPMNKQEYEAFIEALLGARRVISKEFEQKDLFCACQPIEEIARTGIDSPRFGPMKPVGLVDPATGRRPWAALQLRAENRDRTAYNLVGFQTNLAWPEQKRVFRMIPGLENAEFFRYGVMHRNSFVDAPHVLDKTFAIPGTGVRLAGQITGTEGYVEAIASGLLAALNTYAELEGLDAVDLPATTSFGSLVAYATDPATEGYQPMHVNFGLLPALDEKKRNKKERYAAYSERAQADFAAWKDARGDLFERVRDDG